MEKKANFYIPDPSLYQISPGTTSSFKIYDVVSGNYNLRICTSGMCVKSFLRVTENLSDYGYNTHLYAQTPSNLNLQTFRNNIDELKGKIEWIRFALFDREIAPSGTVNSINWNQVNLNVIDEGINYAKENGFKIYLVTNVPAWASNFNLNDYKQVTRIYYNFLADRYKGKVSIWQIFNEANIRNYTDYSCINFGCSASPPLPPSYLSNLNEIITIARSTIKTVDPFASITINAGGYPYDATLHNQWLQYFDALNSNLDLIALDIYPDTDSGIIAALQTRVTEIKNRYSKPVVVAETGMCTATFSESDQANYIPQYINKFKRSNTAIIFLYEYQDDSLKTGCEGTFGIKYANGNQKSSYTTIIQSLS